MEGSYDLIALFGGAGAGKDTILTAAAEKFDLNPIITATTRPMREGEIDGVHYHFVTEEEFAKLDLLESSEFNNWYYGTPKSSFSKDKTNIIVLNVEGINSLVHRDDIKVYPIYVEVDCKERLLRQLNRENKPDCLEICRRFLTDYYNLMDIDFDYTHLNNNTSLDITMESLGQVLYDLGILG